jgi:pSer/pThr/pTyr-binding forkhead associated (FHA) protein
MVDARGAAVAPIAAAASFGLTGAIDESAATRAAAGGTTGNRGGTVALQSPGAQGIAEQRSVTLSGVAGTFRVLPLVESRVGRDGSLCSIALDEPRVSGVHATLKVEGGTLLVRDDKSHNGTYVNGNRIPHGTWTPVPGGSQLRFGPIEFVVRHEP